MGAKGLCVQSFKIEIVSEFFYLKEDYQEQKGWFVVVLGIILADTGHLDGHKV